MYLSKLKEYAVDFLILAKIMVFIIELYRNQYEKKKRNVH